MGLAAHNCPEGFVPMYLPLFPLNAMDPSRCQTSSNKELTLLKQIIIKLTLETHEEFGQEEIVQRILHV